MKISDKKIVDSQDFFARIRRTAIIAMFSDDFLMNKLVLKGGNALRIVHGIGGRTSMDIDFSIDGGDFADTSDLKDRLFRALRSRFDSEGYVLFDEEFRQKPDILKPGQNPKWGGYEVQFKLISPVDFKKFGHDLASARRNASAVWTQHEKKFVIEISRNEYCAPKQLISLDEFEIYVYTLPMIAVEKLRAICQQLPEYTLRKHPARRARDFYDLYAIVAQSKLELVSKDTIDLLEHVFAAKDVPIPFLRNIKSAREFHRSDWPAVVSTTPNLNPPDFDFYFDFVVNLAESLHSFWEK